MFFRFNPINIFKNIILNYKNNINNSIIYLSYNIIYYITGVQILYNKSYKIIKPFVLFITSYIKSNPKPSKTYDINIITNGDVIITINKENLKNNIIYDKNINYDFILYSHIINKVLYKTVPSDYNYNILSYKFINTELITKTKKKLNLSFVTSNYNYFIENNFINKEFILYFIKTHYKDFFTSLQDDELIEYKMNIIDNKINIIEISSLNTILLKKENYVII